ncbi:MAG TPA: hypothetical protein VK335_17830 [Bryobacteraceae bacterium]|nr:hypothetical protein [Bryobacteraceae bacterium]
MSNLEEDLKMALRREEPPADFTDRVLARLNQPPEPSWRERLSVLMRPPRLQWVAASVLLSVLLPFAGVQYHKEQQYQAEGERAKQKLLFAVHVAGSRLHQAQKKVLEGGRMDTRL